MRGTRPARIARSADAAAAVKPPAFGVLDRPRTEASAVRAGHRAFHSRVRSRPEMYLGSASWWRGRLRDAAGGVDLQEPLEVAVGVGMVAVGAREAREVGLAVRDAACPHVEPEQAVECLRAVHRASVDRLLEGADGAVGYAGHLVDVGEVVEAHRDRLLVVAREDT